MASRPEFPDLCAKVWLTFSSIGEVTYSEIAAYTQVTGEDLQGWEVSLLIGLDRVRKSDRDWPKK